MCIHPKKKSNLQVPVFNINGNAIDIVTDYKYLGFSLWDDMKDDIDINTEIRGLYTRGNMVIKCLKHCSDPVKILLSKSYCRCMYWAKF